MTVLLTAAQMRSVEAAAIASGAMTGLELMERAGASVVEAVFAEWPTLAAGTFRAVVLCGPGNSGGGGFVVARLLKEWDWAVEVLLYGEPARLLPDARVNYERWIDVGSVVAWSGQMFEAVETENGVDLYVDAVFGGGLTRAPSENFLSPMLEGFCGKEGVVDIDVPTGLCASSGKSMEENGIVPFMR